MPDHAISGSCESTMDLAWSLRSNAPTISLLGEKKAGGILVEERKGIVMAGIGA